jgi:hypothetical protein
VLILPVRRKLQKRIEELEEELRLAKIVHEGQKDILKKQKHDTEEDAKEVRASNAAPNMQPCTVAEHVPKRTRA